jgi:putative DNA primase/helicase
MPNQSGIDTFGSLDEVHAAVGAANDNQLIAIFDLGDGLLRYGTVDAHKAKFGEETGIVAICGKLNVPKKVLGFETIRASAEIAPQAEPKAEPRADINSDYAADIVKFLNGCAATEDGIARAFAAQFKNLRFDHHAGVWFVWNKKWWHKEETKLAFHWARETARNFFNNFVPPEKATDKLRAIIGRASTALAIEKYARADPKFAVASTNWDRDPFLLGTPNGTVDLRTGSLSPPEMKHYITKVTAASPADTARCPLWLKFLREATDSDMDLTVFLQQYCGYMLTGDTREHALLFIYGPGGNGKSVFLNTVSRILGDYCQNAPMDTFTASANDRHPTDLAMLRGARMVCASETEEGRAWAETRIKQMTGGDPITARFMRQDFFTYTPQFKLVVIGNHKPALGNVDDAAKRRINVVPFIHKPERPDRELETKLREEWPAILRWMIDGCLDWQKRGLTRPKIVVEATAQYFSEQDSVRQWVEDCCEFRDHSYSDTIANLYEHWSDYAKAIGENVGTVKWFSQALERLGCERAKRIPGSGSQGRGFLRIRIKRAASYHDREG